MEALLLGGLKLSKLGIGYGGSGTGMPMPPSPALRAKQQEQQQEFVHSLWWQVSRSKLVCHAVISKSAAKTRLPKERKKGSTGLFRSYTLSPELQALVGEEELSRVEVSKRLWDYIKKNNLQDPDDKRNIFCNEVLRSLFGTDVTDMFQMNKLLSKHIGTPEKSSVAKEIKVSGVVKSSGLLRPQPISKELQAFLGVTETEFVRPNAVKLIWKYIKENNLQDPANKRNIICDKNLHELFQCESFQGFHISKLLVPHFPKRL
ncbi:hypothetical protein O6H91_15G040500 [Diphasiastrum complanatum]|uniref:Uncharacterized protein n=2 Tax=Diphasiastrum complanatum TaxID=34168 RepID=A0ACC2BHN0_DIPCM|nr:hypothetical protein O6H91_15G040500 [Diphasiastrum complanatum]KAJ7529261.1 hypothetical protein O6H91_15G040500 [Diphasiastrum complanatum]